VVTKRLETSALSAGFGAITYTPKSMPIELVVTVKASTGLAGLPFFHPLPPFRSSLIGDQPAATNSHNTRSLPKLHLLVIHRAGDVVSFTKLNDRVGAAIATV